MLSARGLAVVVAIASALAAAAAPAQALTLGDGHVTTSDPRPGAALACAPAGAPATSGGGPWIGKRHYDPARRPQVGGTVSWPSAAFALRTRTSTRAFLGNTLPPGLSTGAFPPGASDPSAPFGAGEAGIAPRSLAGSVRRTPSVGRAPSCVDPAVPVAIGLDGVAILPAFGADWRDAAAREVVDACGGRTDATGLYARRVPACGAARPVTKRSHSGLVGWARDGFPLFGPRGPNGVALRSRDLDACHGHTHRVTLEGRRVSIYHYHVTADFPHTVGCFMGRPARSWTFGPAQPDPTGPLLSTSPGLFPGFDPDVTDYVVRCTAGTPVQVSVAAPAGTRVSVDGGPENGGSFTTSVGLAPGQGFDVRVSRPGGSSSHHVRCLPPDFPEFTVERNGTPQAEWYIVTPSINFRGPQYPYVAIFDNHGVPVWWFDVKLPPADAKLLPDGNLAWTPLLSGSGVGVDPAGRYEERSLDGKLVRKIQSVGVATDQHDLQVLPNGHLLLTAYPVRDHVDLSAYGGPADATVLDGEVQELDADGQLVWSWNTKDHIDLAETGHWWDGVIGGPQHLPDGRSAYDLVHINSVAPDGDGIVVSFRHLDAIYRVDRATGDIDWKLGGTARAESLAFVGDPHGGEDFGGQHDARVLADGTVTVHDNGTLRTRQPRAVRYRLDLTARTATMVEQVIDPQTTVSFCCGSARRLPGGNWVSSWGSLRYVVEQAPDGTALLRISFPEGTTSYRAVPLLPGELSAAALRTGMDAINPRN